MVKYFLSLLALLSFASQAHADFITPVKVTTDVASYQSAAGEYSIDALILDDGFNASPSESAGVAYTSPGIGQSWLGDMGVNELPFDITLYLDRYYDIESAVFWNSLWSATGRNVRDMDIMFYSDDALVYTQSVELIPNRTNPVQSQTKAVDIGYISQINKVVMRVKSLWGSTRFVGLSKVRFIGERSSVANGADMVEQGVVVHDGVAYGTVNHGSIGNHIVAFDAENFDLIGKFDADDIYDHTPIIVERLDGSKIIVVHEYRNERSVAFDIITREKVWETPTGSHKGTQFLGYSFYDNGADGKILYFSSNKERMVAFSAETGETIYDLAGISGGATPAVDQEGGVVYVQQARRVYKIDAATGAELAQAIVPSGVGDAYAIGAWNTVYVNDSHGEFIVTKWTSANSWTAAYAGGVRVYDSDLNLIWEKTGLPTGKKHSVTYFDGKLMFGLGNHAEIDPHETATPSEVWEYATAYNIADGSIAWQSDLSPYDMDGSIFNWTYYAGKVFGETQYSTQSSEKIFRLNADTGEIEDVLDLGFVGTSCAASILAGGVLYSGDLLGHKTHAIRFADDSPDWPAPWGDGQKNQNNMGEAQGVNFTPFETLN